MATKAEIQLLIDTAESGRSLKEFRENIKNIQNALKEATDPADIQRLQTALALARDGAGDFNERLKLIGQNRFERLATLGQTIAGGFQVATGALGLFGTENEKLNEIINQTNALFTTFAGLGQLSESTRQLGDLAAAFGLTKTAKAADTIATEVNTGAQIANTTVTNTATVATTGLGLALKALGIGLLISGLAALITYWDDITEAIGKVTGGTDKLKQTFSGIGSAAIEVGKTILTGLATPVKILYNLITGDLKGAYKVVEDTVKLVISTGDRVAASYKSGVVEKAQEQSIERQIKNLEKANSKLKAGSLERLNNEKRILQLQLSQQKEGSDKYLEIQDKLTQKISEIEGKKTQIADNARKERIKKTEEGITKEQEAFKKLFGEEGMKKIAPKPLTVPITMEPDFSSNAYSKEKVDKQVEKINKDSAQSAIDNKEERKEILRKLFPFLDDESINELSEKTGSALEEAIKKQQEQVDKVKDFIKNAGFGENFISILFGSKEDWEGLTGPEKVQKIIGSIQEISSAVISTLGQLSEARLQTLENDKNNELEQLNNLEQQRLAGVVKGSEEERRLREQFSKSREDIERNYAKKERQIRKEQALFEADLRIFNIIAETAKAVVAALPNLGLSLLAGAIGAVQLGVAVTQRSAISNIKAAKGGLLTGPSHDQGGIQGTGTFGNIEVEGGEFIMNKMSTSKYLPLLNSLNKNSSDVNFNMDPISSQLREVKEQLVILNNNPIRSYIIDRDITETQDKIEFIKRRTEF